MPLRSVVLEPAAPAAPRRTVVLRQGGPRPKGAWLDVLFGVLGALILIIAVALAYVLPDRTYLNPQFRVAFVEGGGEFPSQALPFAEGDAAKDFAFEVPVDNVKSISIDVGFFDDVAYSLPDRFVFDLIAPNGTPMGHAEIQNPDPSAGPTPMAAPVYEPAAQTYQFTTAPTVSEAIVPGLRHTETVEQVQARVEPQHRVATAGTWILRVQLQAAQDCPQPGADGSYPEQSAHCRFGHPSDTTGAGTASDGIDAGNEFRVAGFRYTYYVVETKELS